MNNVGKKIITLSIVLMLTIVAVLAFLHTIVAPPTAITPVNSHYGKFVEEIAKFSTSSQRKSNDSLIIALNDKLNLYYSEALISNNEALTMTEGLVKSYAPVFISQSMGLFQHSKWSSADHKKMREMIKLLNLLNNSASTLPLEPYKNSLREIESIISQYDAAWSLVKIKRFPGIANVRSRVEQSHFYRGLTPLNKCAALVSQLNAFPQKMGNLHYAYLQNRVNELTGYATMSRYDYDELARQVENEINAYGQIKSIYGNAKDESSLSNLKYSYYSYAMSYYNRGYDYGVSW